MRIASLALGAALAGVLLFAPPAPEAAPKLYKWIDEDGQVNYSQTKPPDEPAQEIEVRTGGPPPEASEEQLDEMSTEAEDAREDREFKERVAAEERAREKRHQKNCEIAKQNLRTLQNAPRVKATDDQGNEYFVDDEQRQERIEKTKEQIESFCG